MSTFTQLFNVPQSGMRQNMLDLDTVSNNLANINTEGFKESRLDFQELLDKNILEGTYSAGQTVNLTQGSLKTTNRDMDWAISGNGFFGIQKTDGTMAYTRNGSFSIDSNHKITNSDGLPLVWSGSLPDNAQNVHIDNNGNVFYNLGTNTGTDIKAGTVSLYRFVNPSGLQNDGNNLLLATTASGTAINGQANANGMGLIQGDTLESSNVDLSSQMSHMLLVERIFQTTSKALQQSNTMLSEAIHMRQA